jgi:peptidoglycan/LPS O-acetylase OafA/YrhL
VHNLFPDYAWTLNGPLWSMATEWQIYLVFAVAFVPLWRAVGNRGPILLGLAMAGLLVGLAWEEQARSGLWLVGCFPFGMWAADAAVKGTRGPWGWVAAATAVGTVGVVAYLHPHGTEGGRGWPGVPFDLAVAAGTAAGLVALSRPGGALTRRVRAALEARPVVGLGAFSYSLYLFHAPLLASLAAFARPGRTADEHAAVLFAGVAPACVLFGWVCYRLFERPWLPAGSGQ